MKKAPTIEKKTSDRTYRSIIDGLVRLDGDKLRIARAIVQGLRETAPSTPAETGTDDDLRDSFLAYMARLYVADRRRYREMFGVMRALYLQSNPRPPRGKAARAMHERIESRARPIDFKRAKTLPAAVAEARRPMRRAA